MDYFSTPMEFTFTVATSTVSFPLIMELSTPVFNIMHIMPGTIKQIEFLIRIHNLCFNSTLNIEIVVNPHFVIHNQPKMAYSRDISEMAMIAIWQIIAIARGIGI